MLPPLQHPVFNSTLCLPEQVVCCSLVVAEEIKMLHTGLRPVCSLQVSFFVVLGEAVQLIRIFSVCLLELWRFFSRAPLWSRLFICEMNNVSIFSLVFETASIVVMHHWTLLQGLKNRMEKKLIPKKKKGCNFSLVVYDMKKGFSLWEQLGELHYTSMWFPPP